MIWREARRTRPRATDLEVGSFAHLLPARGWLLGGVALVLAGAVTLTQVTGPTDPSGPDASDSTAADVGGGPTRPGTDPSTPGAPGEASTPPASTPPVATASPVTLPGGRSRIFTANNILVAYYGTAGTGALGVLGERSPEGSDRRLQAQAARYAAPGRPVQKVYELIVTIADSHPGRDKDYNHDLSRRAVKGWIAAAHRHDALVVLDIQPGRSSFGRVARRWAWALADPWVGLALDPEWRMHGSAVPGRRIGHVDAAEINRTTAWLAAFTARRGLPEKLLVVHQFRRDMVRHPGKVVARPGVAMVQHVDGFGTRAQKRSTYRHVARPQQYTMGYKVFYDEDVHRMRPADVLRVRPRVRFVSYQ